MLDKVISYLPSICTTLCLIIAVININIASFGNTGKTLYSLCELIPYWINDAESKGFATGEAKKSYVVELCTAYLSSHLKLSSDKITQRYGSYVDNKIEALLSTPQKKGV